MTCSPCFHTKLRMICAKERGREYVEEQAPRSADDRGTEASRGGAESGGCGARSWVSKHTLYAWKAKYGGVDVSQAQEAKQLCGENAKLRKLVADLSLDKEALQSVIRKNGWSS
jgi:putative transposase